MKGYAYWRYQQKFQILHGLETVKGSGGRKGLRGSDHK